MAFGIWKERRVQAEKFEGKKSAGEIWQNLSSGPDLHLRHVHDQPAHGWPRPHILPHHGADDSRTEIYVCDVVPAIIVPADQNPQCNYWQLSHYLLLADTPTSLRMLSGLALEQKRGLNGTTSGGKRFCGDGV